MIQKSVVDLPLHGGKCPPWLFERMVKLSRAIFIVILEEFDKKELLKRLADPFWFQALGCLLGFDWHSSGLTTTVGGAVKVALAPLFKEIGLFICGGKGKRALQTPSEIETYAEKSGLSQASQNLITISRLVARVDNNAIQDGFQLYFHLFFFTDDGSWAVIQQGMDEKSLYARRYHWYSEKILSFTVEPHSGILSNVKKDEVLNLVAKESESVQQAMLHLLNQPLQNVLKEVRVGERLILPKDHPIRPEFLPAEVLPKIWLKTYENPPQTFEELLLVKGMGAKHLRALTLTSELIYGVLASRKDPVHYAYAHGGKDGHPYRINKRLYDATIQELESIIERIKLGDQEKLNLLRKLPDLFNRIF
jgi:hypothetical protein